MFKLYLRFSPLRYWGSLNHNWNSSRRKFWVLVPFDIGVVSIWCGSGYQSKASFSPLRYWGSLNLVIICIAITKKSFSPLRYWGSLNHEEVPFSQHILVLVPFDIGVVSICSNKRSSVCESFSPLRYWGSLNPITL